MKLSDYKGEAAIELWGNLIEPITPILADNDVKNAAKGSVVDLAGVILKKHPKEAKQILELIDNKPIDAFNVPFRVMEIINDFITHKASGDFFSSAEPTTDGTFIGSAPESV